MDKLVVDIITPTITNLKIKDKHFSKDVYEFLITLTTTVVNMKSYL